MRAINVYAWQAALPSIPGYERVPVCSDGSAASTRMDSGNASWLSDGNWHVSLSYSSLTDLAEKLAAFELPEHIAGEPRRLQRGEIQTLAIDCHGSAGRFYPNGVARGLEVTAANLDEHGEALRGIGIMTASQTHMAVNPLQRETMFNPATEYPASTILIVACNTGTGPQGTRLLVQLSHRWPGRQVVGFNATVVFPNLTGRAIDPVSGDQCVPPFALDSGRSHVDADWVEREILQSGVRPQHLPWANATAASAKIALDGRIITTPLSERDSSSGRGRRASLLGAPRGTVGRAAYSPHSARVRA